MEYRREWPSIIRRNLDAIKRTYEDDIMRIAYLAMNVANIGDLLTTFLYTERYGMEFEKSIPSRLRLMLENREAGKYMLNKGLAPLLIFPPLIIIHEKCPKFARRLTIAGTIPFSLVSLFNALEYYQIPVGIYIQRIWEFLGK
jgi:hypothetical protein